VEAGGMLRVGNPLGATGLLERQAALRTLRDAAARARKEADEARGGRAATEKRLRVLEGRLEEVRLEVQQAQDAHREAQARESARSDRKARMGREVEDLERQLQATRTARDRALSRAEDARSEREGLIAEEDTLREDRVGARTALDEVQEEWETVRGRESDLFVERTRLEGELSRLEERSRDLARSRETVGHRLKALAKEESELRGELERTGAMRRQGATETEALFARRDAARDLLRQRDEALSELEEALGRMEGKAREARAAEREASESRHRLELEAQELDGRLGRIQDRLEGEWGKPYRTLLVEADPVEGEVEDLRDELRETVQALERIGPVNMLAVEEHEEESARLSFLEEQRDDLIEARNDLGAAIREINQTATKLFGETFEAIRKNFRTTYLHLFEGGECDLWLEDPDDPLESDIEIHASPRGKRTQRIDLLSGGERALTALALLFGIYLVKPSPFCVLDEVDAPLDESNIGRFVRLLQDFKEDTQFVVITHNPRTIEAADWIYGVTMEEPGVSSIVGVRLEEALEAAGV
jgi:chromosome segregation protein